MDQDEATTCRRCGRPAVERGTEVQYIRGESLRVTLRGVRDRRCAHCDHRELYFPALRSVREHVAAAVALKPSRLGPGEVRALRQPLWDPAGFARAVGESEAMVREWERDDAGIAVDPMVELVLRLLTVRRLGLAWMPLERLTAASAQPSVPTTLTFEFDGAASTWRRLP